MGVMRCSRGDCENIMCDRYSDRYGYLCYQCFNELVDLGVQTDIDKFMESDRSFNNREATYKYFEAIFSTNRANTL